MKKGSTTKRNSTTFDFQRKLKGKVILMTIVSALLFPVTIMASTATSGPESVQQASIKITGLVTDSGGTPLIGVTIVEKGTTNGVVTDIDGRYTITVKSSSSELVFSYIGYTAVTEQAGNRKELNIRMTEDSTSLEEVVVVGFGQQAKVSVVGSIQSVDVGALKTPSSNLSTSFAGQLAGVIAVQRSGEPGADGADFWIRGISTFGSMKSPLIVIDGVKASTAELNALDPEMIGSFSILKDATATALYGSRGANGVMIVNTKSGRDLDKAIVNVRVESSYTAPTKVTKFVDGVTYMQMFNEAVTARNLGDKLYSQEKIDGTRNNLDPYVFPNVNWYDEMFKSGAMATNANLSIRGGSKKLDYFSSVSFNQDQGILRNNKEFSYDSDLSVQRYVIQNNFNYQVTPTTKVSAKLNANLREYKGSRMSASDAFRYSVYGNPVDFPIRFPDDPEINYIRWGGKSGSRYYNESFINPYVEMVRGYKNTFESIISGSFDVIQDLHFITPGLSLNGLFSFKNWSQTEVSRTASNNAFEVSDYTWNADRTAIESYTAKRIAKEQDTQLSYSYGMNGNRQIYIQGMLNYERTFASKNYVTGMLVYTQEEIQTNKPETFLASLPQRKQGISGRLTYSYDYKYLLEANFGYNGSENFAPKNRWGFFPSVGVGYIVSREKFFEPLNKVVSNLKLRATLGMVGNSDDATRFMYLGQIELQNGNMSYTTGVQQNYGLSGPAYTRFSNPNLTWEVGRKINLGLDLNLWNRLDFTVDLFQDYRKNIFLTRQSVPDILGFSPRNIWWNQTTQIFGNLGEVENKGMDMSMDYFHEFNHDLKMSFKGTFTWATNKILDYDEPDFQQYPNLSRVGHPVGAHLMYVADRLFIDEAEINNSLPQNISGITIRPGDIKYKNIADADGKYDNQIDANDRIYSKYSQTPEIIYGFGTSAFYKKFDFSIFFQGAARTQIMMSGFHPFGNDETRNILKFISDDYWSESNPNIYAAYPRLSKLDNDNNTAASTYWLRDGSFLKLKNAEIGYNLKLMRIYLRGTNLFTISKFKHWDPEQGGGSGLSYPTQRVINLGVQFTFR
ncbi:MAG: TonB-dependent receptor [Proteiniphilum sp.]